MSGALALTAGPRLEVRIGVLWERHRPAGRQTAKARQKPKSAASIITPEIVPEATWPGLLPAMKTGGPKTVNAALRDSPFPRVTCENAPRFHAGAGSLSTRGGEQVPENEEKILRTTFLLGGASAATHRGNGNADPSCGRNTAKFWPRLRPAPADDRQILMQRLQTA
jgi:hypothetical protein